MTYRHCTSLTAPTPSRLRKNPNRRVSCDSRRTLGRAPCSNAPRENRYLACAWIISPDFARFAVLHSAGVVVRRSKEGPMRIVLIAMMVALLAVSAYARGKKDSGAQQQNSEQKSKA